jgi:hypothetical protein
MSRKVRLTLTVAVTVNLDDGIEASEFVENLDYAITSLTDGADVLDTELVDYEVTDSK